MGKKMEIKKSLIEKAPFIILSIIFGIIAVSVKQASPDFKITDEVLQIPFTERLLYGIYGFCIYVYQSLIPVHLSLIHPYPSSMPTMVYFSIVPILALGFWAYKLYKNNQKTTLFGLLFFILNIGLMLQFFPNSYGLINDHYLYLPIIGVGILIAKFATEVSQKYRNITLTFIGLYIGILAISGLNRIDVFSNPINVNSDVIEKYPDSYVAYNNRGTAYYKKNALENALQDLNQAIVLNPKSAFSLNNRSVISMSIGKFDNALMDLNQAISIKPDYADAYSNRAIAKSYINDLSALSDHNKAIGLNPHQPKYYYNRGAYYLQHNQSDLGCRDIQQSRQLGMKQGNPMVDRLCP
jgi:tetratricopeptide (TPR) repeat protein